MTVGAFALALIAILWCSLNTAAILTLIRNR